MCRFGDRSVAGPGRRPWRTRSWLSGRVRAADRGDLGIGRRVFSSMSHRRHSGTGGRVPDTRFRMSLMRRYAVRRRSGLVWRQCVMGRRRFAGRRGRWRSVGSRWIGGREWRPAETVVRVVAGGASRCGRWAERVRRDVVLDPGMAVDLRAWVAPGGRVAADADVVRGAHGSVGVFARGWRSALGATAMRDCRTGWTGCGGARPLPRTRRGEMLTEVGRCSRCKSLPLAGSPAAASPR